MPLDYKILLDTPADGAMALGFDQLADAFTQIIRTSEPRFAIGLFGTWGSGKTTLMRGIRDRLDEDTDAVVWFAAWRYEKEPHLIVPLLDAIREAVLDWGQRRPAGAAREKARTLATTIGNVTASLVAGFSMKLGVPGIGDVSFKANDALKAAAVADDLAAEARTPRSTYHASFTALRDAFAAFRAGGAERIVVFIDDLDRCLPDGALEVLESMKLFFDMKGFVFVVGLDATVVERFVEHRYRELLAANEEAPPISGEAYLRKIFQVPFALRPVTGAQIEDFLEAAITGAALEAAQAGDLRMAVLPYLRELVTEHGFNPRELKRFINAYTIQRMIRDAQGMDGPSDNRVILSLQTIAFRADWAAVQAGLLALRGAMLRAMEEYTREGTSHQFIPYLGTAPPASFLRFLDDPQTGHALIAFAHTGRQIEEFLFDSTSLSSDRGTRHIDAFEALGGMMALTSATIDRAASARDMVPLEEGMNGVIEQLSEFRSAWTDFDLQIGTGLFDDFNRRGNPMRNKAIIEADLEEQRRVVTEALQALRADLQTVMLDLQRDFRART